MKNENDTTNISKIEEIHGGRKSSNGKIFDIVKRQSELLDDAEESMLADHENGIHRDPRNREQVKSMQNLRERIEEYMIQNRKFLKKEHQETWKTITTQYDDLFENVNPKLFIQATNKKFLGGGKGSRNNAEKNIRASVLVVKDFYKEMKNAVNIEKKRSEEGPGNKGKIAEKEYTDIKQELDINKKFGYLRSLSSYERETLYKDLEDALKIKFSEKENEYENTIIRLVDQNKEIKGNLEDTKKQLRAKNEELKKVKQEYEQESHNKIEEMEKQFEYKNNELAKIRLDYELELHGLRQKNKDSENEKKIQALKDMSKSNESRNNTRDEEPLETIENLDDLDNIDDEKFKKLNVYTKLTVANTQWDKIQGDITRSFEEGDNILNAPKWLEYAHEYAQLKSQGEIVHARLTKAYQILSGSGDDVIHALNGTIEHLRNITKNIKELIDTKMGTVTTQDSNLLLDSALNKLRNRSEAGSAEAERIIDTLKNVHKDVNKILRKYMCDNHNMLKIRDIRELSEKQRADMIMGSYTEDMQEQYKALNELIKEYHDCIVEEHYKTCCEAAKKFDQELKRYIETLTNNSSALSTLDMTARQDGLTRLKKAAKDLKRPLSD